ncbi:unnamed protein product [Fusarium graminearum]|nr:unnamed protein product [Fusarium graminearum]
MNDTFDNFVQLPPSLSVAASRVVKYAGTAIKVETNEGTNQETHRFDLQSFMNSVNNRQTDDLILETFKEHTISHRETTLSTIVESIVKFMADAFYISPYEKATATLQRTIEETFANLEENSSSEFLDFNKSFDGQVSSWEYRLHFAFPNPEMPNCFCSLITTIKLEANISDKSVWWGLVGSSSRVFSATISGVKLQVEEGFRN